jgi:cellulose synthase/poly-beta-1,6-N-acetylglucosamine synthase-like glycosyltransferase
VTALAIGLLASSVLLAAWCYLVYPPLIGRLARSAPEGQPPQGPPPGSVEVLVSAADEEAVIGGRVADLLAQEIAASYSIAVGCDGSSDRTAERARAARDPRVRVVEFSGRRGKAAVLNDLVASSSAEVVVFTDANTRFEPGAVARLAASFRDPSVAAACGRLILEGSAPESAFWNRETGTKSSEGRLGVCLGANGAIYAARRAGIEPLPPDTTSMDDFLIPVHLARRGGRIVFVGDAVAREGAARGAWPEMRRRFRIGVGAGQVLRRERWLWNARRRGLLTLVFISRKAARWLSPVLAIAAVAAACAAPQLAIPGAGLLLLAAAAVVAARAGAKPSGLLGSLYYFAVLNLALASGVLCGLLGYRRPVWTPVARTA